jgi:hypothetical protein
MVEPDRHCQEPATRILEMHHQSPVISPQLHGSQEPQPLEQPDPTLLQALLKLATVERAYY